MSGSALQRFQQSVIHSRRLTFERLEKRKLLAIVWANEFVSDPLSSQNPRFDLYGNNEVYARALVNRAIDDWNAAISDQNFDNDSNPLTNDFQLTVNASLLNVSERGLTFNNAKTNGGAGQAGWEVVGN